jgi:Glutathione S-transferase
MEKGLSYDLEMTIPVNVSSDYKKIHPLGKIPALRDGDLFLPDSSVICAYLEKKYPNPPLYPADPYLYGRALWFEEYGDTALAAAIGGKLFFPKFIAPMIKKVSVDEAAIQKAFVEDVPPPLDYLESQLQGDFLVGERFSIADVGVGTHFINLRLCGFSVDAKRWPKLAKYIDGLQARPSFSQLLGEEKQIFKSA